MKIIRGWSNKPERNPLDPTLEEPGLWIEFRGGDICDPIGDPDGWFKPELPKRVLRAFVKWPILPFIAWNCCGQKGYAGFKAYGCDRPDYVAWAGADNVYDGSLALHLSIRNGLTVLVPVLVSTLIAWGVYVH